MYSIGLRSRKRLEKSLGPAKNKYFYPLIAKPIIHVVVIVLVFGVTAANLQARTIPNTGGQGSILFSIVGGSDLELIEETADQARSATVTSYTGSTGSVSTRQTVASSDAIPIVGSQVLVMTGGSAITSAPSVTGALRVSDGPRKVRTKVETYIVQEGDTISTIASSFGISSTTILWANNLGTRDYIRPGQELVILPLDGIKHTVTSGDTLTKLAKKYDVDEERIRRYNKIDDDAAITKGQELIVPDGTPPRTIPAPRIAQAPSIKNVGSVFTGNKPSASPQSGSASLVWPTSGRVITQYWGWRHTGVDIDGHYDSPIYASDGGVVEVAGWGRGYGLQIVVNHGNGFKTRYAHSSKIFVNVGQRVSQGEVLAMVGTTGFSTGTHLHYEVYVNGVRRNPLLYVR